MSKYTDERYCTNCQKDTAHTCYDAGHERVSTSLRWEKAMTEVRDMNNQQLRELARSKAGGANADFRDVERFYKALVKERDEMKKKRSLWGYDKKGGT